MARPCWCSTHGGAVGLGLLLGTLLLELHLSDVHDSGRDAVDIPLLIRAELQHVERSLWTRRAARGAGQRRSWYTGLGAADESGQTLCEGSLRESVETRDLDSKRLEASWPSFYSHDECFDKTQIVIG